MNGSTPGPWVWVDGGTRLVGEGDDQVLAIDLPEFIEDENKALIAAAPDLLEALRQFADAGNWVSAIGPMGDALSGWCGQEKPWETARAAIAKAEGR